MRKSSRNKTQLVEISRENVALWVVFNLTKFPGHFMDNFLAHKLLHEIHEILLPLTYVRSVVPEYCLLGL